MFFLVGRMTVDVDGPAVVVVVVSEVLGWEGDADRFLVVTGRFGPFLKVTIGVDIVDVM